MPLRLHPEVTTTHTAAGTVLLHMRTGRYWQLNPTGTHILQRLLNGWEPDRITNDLAGRYELPPDQVHRDVEAILNHLKTAGLVITS